MSDPDYTPFARRPPPQEPRLEEVEVCWRAVGVTGKTLTCGIYVDDGPGFDIRVGYSPIDFLRTQRVGDVTDGRTLASTWRELMVTQGFQMLDE